MTALAWTDERIEQLKGLWEKGLTASQIAEELGGVSRNAVIGKAHRLGLKSRPSPVKPNEPAAKASARAPQTAAPAEAVRPAAPAGAAPDAASAAPPPFDDGKAPFAHAGTAGAQQPRPERLQAEQVRPDQGREQPRPDQARPDQPRPDQPRVVSIGPGGFMRQGPGDTQAPIPPAPPRRLVPAKPSAEIAGKTSLLDLNERVCRWPMGHPGEPDFHFCGDAVNPGFPYCVQHCGRAYQAQLPRGARRAPPPLPFGGPRVR